MVSLTPEGQVQSAIRRHKEKARGAVSTAVAKGKMKAEPCWWRGERGELVEPDGPVCGALPVDAHHDDYDKPLDVRWLCRKHHPRAHKHVKSQIALPRAGATISMRRFRNDPAALVEPVRVIRSLPGGEREFVGQWIPAWMVEAEQ